jgi:hypothetical protein
MTIIDDISAYSLIHSFIPCYYYCDSWRIRTLCKTHLLFVRQNCFLRTLSLAICNSCLLRVNLAAAAITAEAALNAAVALSKLYALVCAR